MSKTTQQHLVSLTERLRHEVELDAIDGMLYVEGQPIQPSAVRCMRYLVEAGVVEASKAKELDRSLYRLYQNYPYPPKNSAAPDKDWRINVTVLLPGTVCGSERYVLTVGHQNAENQLEIHQVVSGKALFYQQCTEETGQVQGRYTIAGPGDVVSIVPGAWHLTVNIGDEPMVMVDVVRFRGEKPPINYSWGYQGGAAWFFIKQAGCGIVPNPAYEGQSVPPIQEIAPAQVPAHLKSKWLVSEYVSSSPLLNHWAWDEYWELLRACR